MKKLILLSLCIISSVLLFATSPTTILVNSTAGGLSTAITTAGGDLTTVANLTIAGVIDATDFKAMRDNMPLLAELDLSGATIAEYTGTEGTASTTSITIIYPENTVPENAFLGKLSLATITLPVGTTAIADYAFYLCKGLTGTIDLPTSLKSIGNLAFTYTSGISAVTIPASVTSIGIMAFMSCTALVNVNDNNPYYSSVDGVLFNKGKTTLIQCPTSKTGSYSIPETVNSIERAAFGFCSSLTSIAIPTSVTTINDYAFSQCIGLTSLNIQASMPVNLAGNYNTFDGVPTTTCVLHVPTGTLDDYAGATGWTFLTNIVDDLKTPTISSFTPNTAANGTTVTITGTNLTGATAVSFGGTAAKSFTVDSDTKISAVVGAGTTGTVSVTTAGGSATSAETFSCVPNISFTSSINGWVDFKLICTTTDPYYIDWGDGNLITYTVSFVGTQFITTPNYVAGNTVKIYHPAISGFIADSQDLTWLDVTNCKTLHNLLCIYSKLASLDVSQNTALLELNCMRNAITSLDLTNNPALLTLNFNGNSIGSIDLSKNTLLNSLSCGYTNLNSLDISNNKLLKYFSCEKNNLTSLSLTNNTALVNLFFNENQLKSLDVTNCSALNTFYCYCNQLSDLNVANNPNLKYLLCDNNLLTSINVTNNKSLIALSCESNQISELDLSQNTLLQNLDCGNNILTQLDVTKNLLVERLICSTNQLKSLDVTNNTVLTYITCGSNKLTALDVTKNTALTYLDCQANKIAVLDVSNNVKLNELRCNGNQLTHLDISKNPLIATLICLQNNLTFGTLPPLKPSITKWEYWQYRMKPTVVGANVDLSSQLTATDINGTTFKTIYKWYNNNSIDELVAGSDYTEVDGVFTFLKTPNGDVRCEMTNGAFPKRNQSSSTPLVMETEYLTIAIQPNVSTQAVSNISTKSAKGNGSITNLGISNPTSYGFCWNLTGAPSISDNKTDKGTTTSLLSFSDDLTNLEPNTTYYVKAYATNNEGTGYGEEVNFTTSEVIPTISYDSPQNYLQGVAIAALSPKNTGGPVALPGGVSRFAGTGVADLVNGDAATACLDAPTGIAFDASGNMYVMDSGNEAIRKITNTGVVSTFYDGKGILSNAMFLAIDASDNIYVADAGHSVIRKITPAGDMSIFAGIEDESGTDNGYRTSAKFYYPIALAFDVSGNMYITDLGNTDVRKIATDGSVTTIAGSDNFVANYGIEVDNAGNVYVSDLGKNKIIKIKPTGDISDFAGDGSFGGTDGSAGTASFSGPLGLTVDNAGNLYVSDMGNNLIRKITSAGEVSTIAGKNLAENFNAPLGLALDASGNLFVADMGNNIIRTVTLHGYSINPSLPDGLSFDGTTGIISGTPTATSEAKTYEVTATNSGGSSKTSISIAVVKAAVVSTKAVTNLSRFTVTANGEISDLGFPNPTQHGVVWSTSQNPTVALSTKTEEGAVSATGTFSSAISGLTANTLYYVRAYATNDAGTSYGDEISVTTLADIDYKITLPTATNIKLYSATLGATITPTDAPVIDRGICWSTTTGVTIADNKTSAGGITGGTFTVDVSGITRSATIYYRGYVVTQFNETILSEESNFSNIPIFSGTGNWEDATKWNVKQIPDDDRDCPVINGGCTIANYNNIIRCNDLTINTGAKLTIKPNQVFIVVGTFTNQVGADGFVIKADPTLPNATFAFINGSPLATVEMYSKASWDLTKPSGSRYSWQYFGIPVKTLPYSDAFNSSIVRRHNEIASGDADLWKMETADSTLTSGTGYELTQAVPTTYSFKGELTNADFSKTLPYSIGAKYPGQHIFSNPYTAAIQITEIAFGANTEESVYLYNSGTYNDWQSQSTNDGNAPGQYTVSTKLTAGKLGIPAQIPSMQGFLVKTTNNATGSLAVNYFSSIDANNEMQRAPGNVGTSESIITRIDVTSARAADRMWIFTDPTCTRKFDNGWDGYKMMGSVLNPQLFAIEQDGNYQIDAVPNINETYLGFQAGQDTEFTLKFTQQNVASTYSKVYLMDLVAGKITDITNDGSEYQFSAVSTPAAVKRFKIVTSTDNTSSKTTITDGKLRVFNSAETVYIENFTDQKGTFTLYDMKGIVLKTAAFDANKLTTISTQGLVPGAYLAKVGNGIDQVATKIIIR